MLHRPDSLRPVGTLLWLVKAAVSAQTNQNQTKESWGCMRDPGFFSRADGVNDYGASAKERFQ